MTKLVLDGAAKAVNEGKLNSKEGRATAEGSPVANAAAAAALAGAVHGVPQAKAVPGVPAAPAKAQLDAAKFVRPDEDEKDKKHDDEKAAKGEGETRHLAMVDEASAAAVGTQVSQVAQDGTTGGGSGDDSSGGGEETALYVGGGLLAVGAIVAVAASGGDDEKNVAPAFAADKATATVAENAATTTVVFDANATDANSGDTITYSLSGADAAAFNINATTGEVTLKASADFEAKASYSINVVATDKAGASATQAVAVTVTNVNEAPVISSDGGGATAARSVAENTTAVTTVTATDVDAGTTLTYSLSGVDAALFAISSTGVLTFKNAPNFEAPADAGANNVYDVTVKVTDNGNPGLFDEQALAITVTNVGENPPVAVNDKFNVNENTALSGTVATNDNNGDGGSTGLTYTLVGAAPAGLTFNADGSFSFNANVAAYDGLATGATQDVAFTYKVTDADGSAQATATITVTGANDAPTITSATTPLTVAESAPVSTVIYNADAADTDSPANTLVFSLSGADAAAFNINATTGEVTLKSSADFETKPTYNFNVVVSDGTASTTQALVLNVTDVVETTVSADQDNDGIVLTPATSAEIAGFNAGTGSVTFTENAETANTVVLSNFGTDDRILVSKAEPGDFNFNVSSSDNLDLIITYSHPNGAVNSITLDNFFAGVGTPPPNVAFSNSETAYETYVGFDFFQFA